MLTKRARRRWITVLAIALVGAVSVGGVVASQFVADPGLGALDASLRESPLVKIADIAPADDAAARGVFAQSTSAGFLCLYDAPSAGALNRQGGCNSADDPFGGKRMFISLAYEGGPAASDVKDARLVGLTSDEVSRVQVVMSDGTRRTMVLQSASIAGESYRAFGYRFEKADLRKSRGPVAVVALDGSGQEIDRQATGFGG